MPYTPPLPAAGSVGLGNVDNTSDAAKPVSTAQATAIALKAPLASPAFTGTPAFAATGITVGGDANLYRYAADFLKTDDGLIVAGANFRASAVMAGSISAPAAGTAITVDGTARIRNAAATRYRGDVGADTTGLSVSAYDDTAAAYLPVLINGKQLDLTYDAVRTFRFDTGAKILFGTTGDTNLYRSAADMLATDDQFRAVSNSATVSGFVVGIPSATDGAVSASIMLSGNGVDHNYINSVPSGTAANRRIRFGRAGGADFSAVVSFISLAGDSKIYFGSAEDTNLYRSAADTLKTDDSFAIGGNVGFYGTAPIVKPTVTGSRTDGTALASLLTALASQGLITNSSSA